MYKRELNQEPLKVIACVTMLLDHVGAVFIPWQGLRIIGRISFPIFCFLLVEGWRHTRSPQRYALRLALGAVLAELPYDLLFYGGIHWQHQNVMLTLLIGLLSLLWKARMGNFAWISFIFGCALAELAGADYGGFGVALIWLFDLMKTEHTPKWLLPLGMACIFLSMNSAGTERLGIPVQLFGLLAILPISCYTGRKTGNNPLVKWGFYMFYPGHLLLLWGFLQLSMA